MSINNNISELKGFLFEGASQPATLIIYSPKITSRLRYVCKFIFNQGLQINFLLIDNESEFLQSKLPKLNYSIKTVETAFNIYPNGLLLRLGVLGVYWPFIGQGQVDNAIPVMLKPFIYVHEMSHAYGFTDEGSCNFLAYIACKNSNDPVFKYSADIALFRTVAGNYKYIDSTGYLAIRSTIPTPIRQDLDSVNVMLRKYPTWVSTTAVYDWYLKAEGIEEGIENYDNIIAMVKAWREKNQRLRLKNN